MALQAALKRSRVATSATYCARLGASSTASVNFIEHPFYTGRASYRRITQPVSSASPPAAFLRQLKQAASSGANGEGFRALALAADTVAFARHGVHPPEHDRRG